ncbi:MAG: probable exported protein STY0357 [uncultured Microvirga sp.]|uniref:Probable exported protein STY0357 n=1 Tax=uncultured Microvirga sp. TaxID=412392 RepID=A0A6J4KHM1_9HYPH|nr:MAG: probable exported protein STY0357 [uncultured Microvirga sp.]
MLARSHLVLRIAAGLLAGLAGGPALAGSGVPKHMAPIPAAMLSLMAGKDTGPAAPILIRTFKKEAELEVWKKARNGRFVLLKTFPICRWSGQLGPKRKEGDRQTPEGFYAVTPALMNPNSAHYLSFDTGFPNAFDRAQGATGSYLMVHGTCSSRGCFAMTDAAMGEIYALAREAFAGGQRAFQFQGFPFRMTAANMVKHRQDPHIGFWRQLKEGADRFEATFEEPIVGVAAGRYTFRSAGPEGEAKASARRAEEEARIAALIEEGPAAIRTTYADGGQHASFRALSRAGAWLGEISRPETLALAGREVIVTPARPKPPTQVAEVKAVKSWPVAPDLGALQGAPKPLPDEPSLFVFTALNQSPAVGEPPIAGSLRIVPARLTEMAPLVLAPI